MKILLLANNLPWKTWDKKIQELKDWWLPEIKLDITLEEVNFTDIPWIDYTSTNNGQKYKGIEPAWYDTNITLPAVKRGFDCVMFTVGEKDWADRRVEGWNTTNNLGIHEIQILGRENAKYNFQGKRYEGDQWFNIARHELSHAIYRSRGITDNTHKWWEVGNLAEIKKELAGGFMAHPLVLYFQRLITPPKKYKYFNQNEVEGLKPELVSILDKMREESGFPYTITSGLRTPAQNKALKDSASNSGHLRGWEVDIACTDSSRRDKIIELSYKYGITRRGIGNGFVHLGIDPTLPQRVMWTYYK